MSENEFNYRQQLVELYHLLDDAALDFYSLGFSIGLEEEWQDWKVTLKDGDTLPIDIEIFKSLNHRAIPDIIKMIEILADARESLSNLNSLSEEELEVSDDPDSNNVSEEEHDRYLKTYLDYHKVEIFGDLNRVYEALWELAFSTEPPNELYDDFHENYYTGELQLASDDQNVQVVLEALNKVLVINRGTDYD
ncbi:hypothetical protein [Desertivirga xinjiangensis]|uniref:hypothetical protein n=1 Tax=Desertivirga xinjiangensis TaxID=539206 RepID=UPI00210C0040|nr:hypothetical protein [Pedobacter xinjiangensis]